MKRILSMALACLLILTAWAVPAQAESLVATRTLVPIESIPYERPDSRAIVDHLEALTAEVSAGVPTAALRVCVEEAGAHFDDMYAMYVLVYVTDTGSRERSRMESVYWDVATAYQDFLYAVMLTEDADLMRDEYPRLLDANLWDLTPLSGGVPELLEEEERLVAGRAMRGYPL